MRTSSAFPGDGLLHPAALIALILLIVNDHFFKHYAPGFLSGKLSDVAGLFVAPLVLEAAYEFVTSRRRRPLRPSFRVALACTLAVAVAFTLMETWTPASLAFRYGLALAQWPFRALFAGAWVPLVPVRHVADAEDLIALPALLGSLWLARRRVERASSSAQLEHTNAGP